MKGSALIGGKMCLNVILCKSSKVAGEVDQ